MIRTFRIYRLNNPEYVQFMDYVVQLGSDNDPAALNVEEQFDLLSQRLIELKKLFKTALASPITKKIAEADRLRDEILTGLIKMTAANRYHYQQNLRVPATLLHKNLRFFGHNIIRDNYDTKTAKVESIVRDWRTKTYLTAAMNALHLDGWIEELGNANNEFKRLYALRNEEYSQKPSETMESKRLETTAAYDDLCRYLNSYSLINSDPNLAEVVAGINSYVDHYASMVRGKKTVKEELNVVGSVL